MNTHQKAFAKSPWTYFAATYLWSWGLCGILILNDTSDATALSFILLILAMIGPGVTGIAFTHLTKSKEEIRDYWTRIIDFRRLSLPWLTIAIGLPFALQIVAGVIDGLAGGSGLRWGELPTAFTANPLHQLLSLSVISLVPFFEELGWRGYAQDLLQKKGSALWASLLIGCAWSLWHLPASFIPHTYQAQLGIGTLEFWLHFGGIIVLSVVISWIYINTHRSILVMAIFHAMINLSGDLFSLSEMGETIYTFCWVSAAIAIVFGFGKDMRVSSSISREAHLRQAVLLLLVGGGLQLAAATLAPAPAQAQDLKARFQSELETLHRQYNFPGATAAYILPNGTVEGIATGLADGKHNIPMSAQSSMLAASVGKTFVIATVLALVQEEQLHLDAPIAIWLADRPWFARLANHEDITLRQLLNHTSGLANHVESEAFAQALTKRWREVEKPMSPEELITYILDQPPLFAPGEGWSYSDTGYLLVGLIIEKATGHTYYQEVERRFLNPLALALTMPANQLAIPNLATGYMAVENAFGLPPQTTTRPGVMAWHPGIEWTGGGLASNPRDLVVWGKSLLSGRALTGDYLVPLLQSVPLGEAAHHVRYGLGIAVHADGPFGPSYGHGGWIPGYCTSLRYYPHHDVAIAFQINTDIGVMEGDPSPIDEIEQRLAGIVIDSVARREPSP